jgi:hypothetical protein
MLGEATLKNDAIPADPKPRVLAGWAAGRRFLFKHLSKIESPNHPHFLIHRIRAAAFSNGAVPEAERADARAFLAELAQRTKILEDPSVLDVALPLMLTRAMADLYGDDTLE